MNIERLLRLHEEFVSAAYKDSRGYLTIGIGRLIDARKNGGITEDEALYLLRNDLQRTTEDLYTRMSWLHNLSEIRQAAIIDMAFNLGVAGLSEFKRMLAALQDGDYERAADEALRSQWAEQVGIRAEDIDEMIRHDRWPERLT